MRRSWLWKLPAGAMSVCAVLNARATERVWRPTNGSDLQWTTAANWNAPLGTVSPVAPQPNDSVQFTNLLPTGVPAPSPLVYGYADPTGNPPSALTLAVSSILADGYFDHDSFGVPQTMWQVRLDRPYPNNPFTPNLTSFNLDIGGGNGTIQIGTLIAGSAGNPPLAVAGGLSIAGAQVFDSAEFFGKSQFNGMIDVRYGQMDLQNLNGGQWILGGSSMAGIVDNRGVSGVTGPMTDAILTTTNCFFDDGLTKGFLVGSTGTGSVELISTDLVNLRELRIGGNSALDQTTSGESVVTVGGGRILVGNGTDGHVYIGDQATPSQNGFNGILNLNGVLDENVVIDPETQDATQLPVDVYVGHDARGQLNITRSASARKFIVGDLAGSYGEVNINSGNLTAYFPLDDPETPEQDGFVYVARTGNGAMNVVGGSSEIPPSNVIGRTMVIARDPSTSGSVNFGADSFFSLADYLEIGRYGHASMTIAGQFFGFNTDGTQTNAYAPSGGDVGLRPNDYTTDPNRYYSVFLGTYLNSSGSLLIGSGGHLHNTDIPPDGQPDQTDDNGTPIWKLTNHAFIIGRQGTGYTEVQADSMLETESLYLGETPTGQGTLNLNKTPPDTTNAFTPYNEVRGVPGTALVHRNAFIGFNGAGTLSITGRYVPRTDIVDTFDQFGLVTAGLAIGYATGSTGVASVSQGGQILVNGTNPGEEDLFIGRAGAGTVSISDPMVFSPLAVFPPILLSGASAGTVSVINGYTSIGQMTGGRGSVTVDPNGLLSVQTLDIGGAGTGTLTTHAGAVVQIQTGTNTLVTTTIPAGTVLATQLNVFANGSLNVQGTKITPPIGDPRDGVVHASVQVLIDGGTVTLGSSSPAALGWIVSPDVTMQAGAIRGNGTLEANVTNSGGTIAPGFSAGTINITGTFAQSASGVMEIELGNGVSDRLNISGAAALGGTLRAKVVSGVFPVPGTSWDVMTFASHSGDVTIDNQTGYAGLFLLKTYGATKLTLTAEAALPGDANLDGHVNTLDFTALASHFNQTGIWPDGNFNSDSVVNALDFNILATNFGASIPGVPGPVVPGVVVPEPGLGMIGAVATIALTRRRRINK